MAMFHTPPPPPEVLDEKLKRLLQFTDDDLVANRTGEFSEFQLTRMRYEKDSAKHILFAVCFIGFVLGGIVLAAALGGPNRGSRSRSDNGGGALLTCVIVPMVFLAPLLFQAINTSQDLDAKKVLSVKGPIQHRTYWRRRAKHHQIIVGDKTFNVDVFLYKAFARDEVYCLYYTPNNTLIAAERVPPQT